MALPRTEMSPAELAHVWQVSLNMPVELPASATAPVADMLILPLGASKPLWLLIVAPPFRLNWSTITMRSPPRPPDAAETIEPPSNIINDGVDNVRRPASPKDVV